MARHRGRQASSARPERYRSQRAADSDTDEMSVDSQQSPQPAVPEQRLQAAKVPSGQELLPYIDSFLENVHPIGCNNFLHPGYLCEGLDRAPSLLLLAICASSCKFMAGADERADESRWAAEARHLIMNSFHRLSTLTIAAIQFLVLHELHGGEYTSAWNLVGTAELERSTSASHSTIACTETDRRRYRDQDDIAVKTV